MAVTGEFSSAVADMQGKGCSNPYLNFYSEFGKKKMK